MRQIFCNDTLQEDFLHKGYVQIPLLSEAEVAGILKELGEMRPHDNFDPGGEGKSRTPYHCSFLDTNLDYRRHAHRVIKGIFDAHIQQWLVGYELLNCNFYVKPPGTGEFTIHQNWPTIADLDDTTVTIWCPLVDVVESNGALQVVEGSHKILPHIEGPGAPPFFADFQEALIEKYLTPIPMKAGEAVIFDDGLIHWSAKNDSTEPRVAIQILCIPRDAVPVHYHFNPRKPKQFEMIAADSEFYLQTLAKDLRTRQPHWKRYGLVANRNRLVTEQEFAALLQNGDAIRRDIYFLTQKPTARNEAHVSRSVFGKIKKLLKWRNA